MGRRYEYWIKQQKKDNSEQWLNRERNQRFYKSSSWKQLRTYVISTSPLCVMCLALGHTSPATEIDHIENINECWAKRLDVGNLQPLCKHHHSVKTRQEMIARHKKERDNDIEETMKKLNEFKS